METPIQLAQVKVESFTCPKDGREFASENALRMHTMRVHTSAGRQGAMWKKKVKTSEQILNRQRDYNKKMRARYVAQGLTSRGKPRVRPYVDKTDRNKRHREYNRNWYHQNKAKRKIQIVYPGPETRAAFNRMEDVTLSAVERIEEKIIDRVAEKIFSTIWSADK